MQEEQSRKLFERRIERINKFNKRKDRTFKMEVNHLTDLSENQRKGLSGFKFSVFANTFLTQSAPVTGRDFDQDIPDSLDWRKFGVVAPVQDQGFICGACWAFATTTHLESIIAIATNSSIVKLSEQQLIDCNRNPKIGNYGCDVS
jgi:cathepsin L/cathepsin K